MESAGAVGSEFRIDQRHIPRLIEVGEFFAAGFFGRPDDAVVVRIAEGLRCIARHRRLPEYRGELLYPAGASLWQGAEARWFALAAMPDLAFDHKDVLETALEWLSARLGISTEEPPCFLAMTSEEQSALRRWLAETV